MNDVKLPIHSLEAEEAVLAAVLCDNDVWGTIKHRLYIDDFYRAASRNIFEAMINLKARSEPINIITVANELERMGLLSQSGGLEYLSALENTEAAYYAAQSANWVKEMAWWRRVVHETTELANDILPSKECSNGSAARYRLKYYLERLASMIDHRLEPINSKGAHENT
jgi:replicative DNA helicase